MNLPVIDIPVQLPFEVPVMVHPVFVHFAIAIPVIVFLLEIANIKARNRAVSVTSLFLMTLALLVYAGAFFSGKADGSHAFAALSADAKEELKFHKLLGTYMVYGIGVLFLMKILAMLVKRPWARDMFIAFLLVFIGVMFKQGKDGGELVYEYGVNVEPVSRLQDKIDEMEYEIEDLKNKTAPGGTTESAPAPESREAAPSESGSETPATQNDTTETAPQSAAETTEEAAHDAAAAAEQSTREAVHDATQSATEAVHDATEAAGEAVDQAAQSAEKSVHDATEDTTPVEIPTH